MVVDPNYKRDIHSKILLWTNCILYIIYLYNCIKYITSAERLIIFKLSTIHSFL